MHFIVGIRPKAIPVVIIRVYGVAIKFCKNFTCHENIGLSKNCACIIAGIMHHVG